MFRSLVVLLTLAAATPSAARPRFLGDEGPRTFATPPILRKNVALWTAVYGRYDSWQQIYYDTREMDLVLSVLDLRKYAYDPEDSAAQRRAKARRRVAALEAERKRIQRALLRLQRGKRRGLSRLERKLWRLYRGRRRALRGAHRRVGTHAGLRDRFAEGLKRLARYEPYLVEVLRRHRLPRELLALAMTESLFNPRARSKAGAYGAWQFLRETGKQYLHINRVVDERRDPIISTDAAARMLKDNLRRLKRWPLALTGYNYGPNGMARAARELGTYDLTKILRRWKAKRFKFASRNYYASFLAALQVMKKRQRYFPKLDLPRPLRFDTVRLPASAPLSGIARHCRLAIARIVDLNPALTDAARRSRVRLPQGFPLRVPAGKGPRCGRQFHRVPGAIRRRPAGPRRHRVGKGESIIGIARRYGVTVSALLSANGMAAPRHLRVGEVLRVPAGGGGGGYSLVLVGRANLAKAPAEEDS